MAARSRTPTRRKAGSRGVPRAVREPQILEAAGRLFAARGYHAASMEEIAAQAGVTKPLVYAYFGSKEDLYVAYIERSGIELLDRMRRASDPSSPPGERLRAGSLEFLRFVEERRHGWQILHAEATTRGGPLAKEVASLREGVAQMIKRLLMETLPDAPVSDEATAVVDGVAHAVVGAGESLANWWLGQPDLPPERAVDLLVAFAQAGMEQARYHLTA